MNPTEAPATPIHIPTPDHLRAHLQAAIELEHATIPPYLCALYSLKPGANPEAAAIILSVMRQEMLHLVLAANVLNAIGGTPLLDHPGFIPRYPATLPIGVGGPLIVNLRKFSPEAIETFLAIERPAPSEARGDIPLAAGARLSLAPGDLSADVRGGRLYPSIGAFYAAIERGLIAHEALARRGGGTLFEGAPGRQIPPRYYYNGSGAIIVVRDLGTALAALRVIRQEGEGFGSTVDDPDAEAFGQGVEPAHFYRFEQIRLGRFFKAGDTPRGGPTGEAFTVSYDASCVHDMAPNPSWAAWPPGAARDHAEAFSGAYGDLLAGLERALNGDPGALDAATATMFALKDRAVALMRNPLPGGGGQSAGPTFLYHPRAAPALAAGLS